METGHRSQHEKSEGTSKREQQTNMETFHSNQASKDHSVKENTTTHENKEILQQSIDKCVHQVTKEKIIEQSTTSNN